MLYALIVSVAASVVATALIEGNKRRREARARMIRAHVSRALSKRPMTLC